MPAKINLELSGYWPAPGVLRLNFKGMLPAKEKEKEKENDNMKVEKRKGQGKGKEKEKGR